MSDYFPKYSQKYHASTGCQLASDEVKNALLAPVTPYTGVILAQQIFDNSEGLG
jgi:hypothetical protein